MCSKERCSKCGKEFQLKLLLVGGYAWTSIVYNPNTNGWLGGRCPLSLAEFVAYAPLTPLLKPNGGICPVDVGDIWRSVWLSNSRVDS